MLQTQDAGVGQGGRSNEMSVQGKFVWLTVASAVAVWAGYGAALLYLRGTLGSGMAAADNVQEVLLGCALVTFVLVVAIGASASRVVHVQLETARKASDALIQALDQLRHSDRVATIGRLASSVAHELGNPLNVIEMRAQLLVAGDVTTLADARDNASIIVSQARRMTRIIGEILSFARRQPPHLSELDLVSVVRNAIALSEHTARKRLLSIRFEPGPTSVDVHGDGDKLLQIVVNLVLNGVEATEAGGVVQVGVRNAPGALRHDPFGIEEPYVCIDVIDHGIGIPQESISKVFDPFFSTKLANEGTGLGLSIAQGIAKEHEGWIEVESTVGCGSHFTVYLPRDGRKDSSHGWQAAFRG